MPELINKPGGTHIIGWIAWMASEPDGSDLEILKSEEQTFAALRDIQVVMVYVEGRRQCMAGTDYYWLTADACESHLECFGNGDIAPDDAAVVIEGKEIDDDAFDAIKAEAWAQVAYE